ncbi:SWI/SNF complex subunit Snf59 [Schizosaccharomyces octosporus yFS286]|uniref:SWI/SNF complex subunit Snf59 n=1 Tax=Schizosaccharomyces octosporus (strain yFS286) TaxID=483514 RepID=S9PPS4_SCHOY|nr:SWI/SNF complex subunit Snf59 [Schizosaccharomyces octosporus yFS286]EPX71226.1 SWI/SNF complex subunit Snf59 [Schizosaccharomyces octosporus yFS286]
MNEEQEMDIETNYSTSVPGLEASFDTEKMNTTYYEQDFRRPSLSLPEEEHNDTVYDHDIAETPSAAPEEPAKDTPETNHVNTDNTLEKRDKKFESVTSNAVIDKYGRLADGLEYKARTFCLNGRGDVLYMLGTECARILGFKDSYFMFHKTPNLRKISTSQAERDQLVYMGILAQKYRFRQLSIVPARQVFLAFGPKILLKGTVDPQLHKDLWDANWSWADEEFSHLDNSMLSSTRSSSVKPETSSMDQTMSGFGENFQEKYSLALMNDVSNYNTSLGKMRNFRRDALRYYYHEARSSKTNS